MFRQALIEERDFNEFLRQKEKDVNVKGCDFDKRGGGRLNTGEAQKWARYDAPRLPRPQPPQCHPLPPLQLEIYAILICLIYVASKPGVVLIVEAHKSRGV